MVEKTSAKTVASWIGELFSKDWKTLLKSYSFIFHVVAALITVVEIVLPYMAFIEPVFGGTTYGILMFVLNVLGAVGRLMNQKNVP